MFFTVTRRLDQPQSPRRPLLRPQPEAFGVIAERIARFIGTARFLVAQSAVIALWLAVNAGPGPLRFDRYPFSFLTLVLSLQAAYTAPLILLAQNRQDDRDRITLGQEQRGGEQLRATAEFITVELAVLRHGQNNTVSRDYLDGVLARQLDDVCKELASLRRSLDTETAP